MLLLSRKACVLYIFPADCYPFLGGKCVLYQQFPCIIFDGHYIRKCGRFFYFLVKVAVLPWVSSCWSNAMWLILVRDENKKVGMPTKMKSSCYSSSAGKCVNCTCFPITSTRFNRHGRDSIQIRSHQKVITYKADSLFDASVWSTIVTRRTLVASCMKTFTSLLKFLLLFLCCCVLIR